jgi:hypothetical protein
MSDCHLSAVVQADDFNDVVCLFCGCCLWSECQDKPCPELVEALVEHASAPLITMPVPTTARAS